MMNSLVFTKQITRMVLHSGVDLCTGELTTEGTVFTMNPFDEVALEAALRVKADTGDGRVGIITLGPQRAAQAVRWGLAMGADHAVHAVETEETFCDPWMTARLLTEAASGKAADLFFFGRVALDDGMGQVGTLFAEINQLPVVTAVTALDVSPGEKKAVVRRMLARGNQEAVQVDLPAVFTIDTSLGQPRYPTFPGRKRAAAAAIERFNADRCKKHLQQTMNGAGIDIRSFAQPKIRPKKILSPDSGLSAAGRMKFVMTGGMGNKGGNKLTGGSEKLAEGIFNYLKERRFLKTDQESGEERSP